MGGRGGSSGGGSSAKKTVATPIAPIKPSVTQEVQKGQNNTFMSLSDDEKAAMIENVHNQSVPVFLADNDFQKLTYSISEKDMPKLVSDAALDKTAGTEMFRTVNGVKDTRHGISYDADMIAAQIQKGSVTRVSDSGGSYYGRGIYFADNYRDSVGYGKSGVGVKSSAVVRAKLDPTAKTISYSKAINLTNAEIKSGSKLGKALAKCDSASRVSIYALSKGYSALTDSSYINILRRNALVMSSDIKAVGTRWR